MNVRKRAWTVSYLSVLLVGLVARAEAVSIDQMDTLSVTAKAQTRVTFRLQDSAGFTYPDTRIGDLVQWRNLVLLEVDHDLKELTKSLDILWPLKKLKIRTKYHLVGRFMYDALYNVGSDGFKAVRDNDKENIDNFKQSYDLWEFYVDLRRGPAFFRIGKQNLAWGETDIFRLLDGINPLDNTFGGPFEDLDDRRIPLWMLRGAYNLGTFGPVASLSIEGFWVPGNWDVRVGPWAPEGTPYSAPLPEIVYDRLYVRPPDKKMSNSRWGVRLQGMLGSANVSAAYYQTFLDIGTPRIITTRPIEGPLLDVNALQFVIDYPALQIAGGSINFFESITNAVFRGEVAWFFNEPVFIQGVNDLPAHPEVIIPLPPTALSAAALLLGVDFRSLGLSGIPWKPRSGLLPTMDVFRWMLGFDKQVWMRPVNKTSMFLVSMQWFGTFCPDHDDNLVTPAPIPDKFLPITNSITGDPIPDYTQYPSIKQMENIFTGLITTNYLKGSLTPQLALAYDARGVWLVLPSVQYVREPFRFGLQYAAVLGNFVSFGALRDRDQIAFTFAYLLN
jgi:hypothetical protein